MIEANPGLYDPDSRIRDYISREDQASILFLDDSEIPIFDLNNRRIGRDKLSVTVNLGSWCYADVNCF